MSIGEFTMSQAALSEQPSAPTKKPPPKRQTTAQSDAVIQPEPR